MEDTTTDETLSQADGSDELAKQFLHPGYSWRGLPLRPYGVSTEILFRNAVDYQNDQWEMICLTFMFVHLYDREKLIDLCWNKREFRKALLQWAEELELKSDDYIRAMELFEEIRGMARKSSIEVVPDPDLPQKKTRASRRQRSRG
jgi:hypothetical protein